MYDSLLTTLFPRLQSGYKTRRFYNLLIWRYSITLIFQAQAQVFVKHSVNKPILFTQAIFPIDLDQDVLASNGSEFIWYENVGAEFFTRNIIAVNRNINYLTAADLDKDGDIDILADHNNGNISWYENDGTQILVSRLSAKV